MINEWCFKRLKGWLSANCHVWAQGREGKEKNCGHKGEKVKKKIVGSRKSP